jgi:hypothetical protein
MSNPIVKKVVIKKEDLPAFSGEEKSYMVRYRIVSEDKNRSSHWSPYYTLLIPTNNTPSKQVACSVSVSSGVINMVWKHPTSGALQQYEIYIKTNTTDWSYLSSSSSTQLSSLVPAGITSFQVAVQVPTYPKKYFIDAAIFTSTQISV